MTWSGARRCLRTLLLGLCLTSLALAPRADDVRVLRIGTGATGATYFAIGGLIASIVSHPPGSRTCEEGGSCGVPGVIAAAVSTEGSVDNVLRLAKGELDLALCQADVAFDAVVGGGRFDGAALPSIRAIANLYPEAVHLVVRRDSKIASVSDLANRPVSMGEEKSGTRVLAGIVLSAFGLSEADVQPAFMRIGPAVDALVAGELDALFMVGGPPVGALVQAFESGRVDLLPIAGPAADAIRENYPFINANVIPDGTYPGIGAVPTLKVGALLITSASLDADLVYKVTRALWHERNRRILDQGPPNARMIQLETALDGLAIPIHDGALRFYEDIGLVTMP
jgi:uncharacterized protein